MQIIILNIELKRTRKKQYNFGLNPESLVFEQQKEKKEERKIGKKENKIAEDRIRDHFVYHTSSPKNVSLINIL